MNNRGTQHGIFLVRTVLGSCFVMHGLQKSFGVMGGMTYEQFASFLASKGAPMATFSAYVIPWAELLAGIALLVGFAHKLAASVVILVMAGAILYVHSESYFTQKGGMEYPVALVAMAFLIFMAGPGSFAYKLDLKQNKPPTPH